MGKTYAGIGRRKAPKEILVLFQLLAFELASRGYVLQSGGAIEGSDHAFLRGVLEFFKTQISITPNLARIYVPSPWHKAFKMPEYQVLIENNCLVTPDELFLQDKARELAASVHPNWEACKGKFAELAHSRNPHILLGDDLTTPVERVICWCEEAADGTVTGGTATAINLARKFNIPVINVYHQADLDRVLKFLDITHTQLMDLAGVHHAQVSSSY